MAVEPTAGDKTREATLHKAFFQFCQTHNIGYGMLAVVEKAESGAGILVYRVFPASASEGQLDAWAQEAVELGSRLKQMVRGKQP